MRTALLLAAVLLAPATPAFACGSKPQTPSGMVTDEARLKPLVERMLAAQALREKTRKDAWEAAEKDPEVQALKKRLQDAAWNSDARRELEKEYDARLKRDVWDKVGAAAPISVIHHAYLCGSVTLEDGHSINAGSSWSLSRDDRPELGRLGISGEEMHYVMEHHQATPHLIETLEKLLLEAPTPAARLQAVLKAPFAWN